MVVSRGLTVIIMMTLCNKTMSSTHAPRVITVTLALRVCTLQSMLPIGKVLDFLIVDYAELCYTCPVCVPS